MFDILAKQIAAIGKVAYQSSPTVTTLRDALISLGLMDAAPAVTAEAEPYFYDTDKTEFYDTGTTEFFDF